MAFFQAIPNPNPDAVVRSGPYLGAPGTGAVPTNAYVPDHLITVKDLKDIADSFDPATGDTIVFDAVTRKWSAGAAGPGAPPDIGDIGGVDLDPAPTGGQVLTFVGAPDNTWQPRDPALPAHTLESHSNVQDVTVGGQVLVKNNVTNEWQGTGRITVDAATNDNVTVGLLAGGVLTVNTPSSNILSTNTGGSVTLGDSARACEVLGDEVSLTASAGVFLAAPDGIALTTTVGAISVSATSESVLLGVGTGATDVVRITEDSTDYAAKIGAIAQAVPNVEFVNNQISAIPPPSLAFNDLTDANYTGADGRMIYRSATSGNFQQTDSFTIDDLNNGNITVTVPALATLTMQTATTNILSTNTGGSVTLGDASRLLSINADEIIANAAAGFNLLSPNITLNGGVSSMDSSTGNSTISAGQNVFLSPAGSDANGLIQQGGTKTAATYAADAISFGGTAIPNMEAVNSAVTTAIGAIPAPSLALDDLTNVTVPTPNNFDILTYDDGTNSWIAAPPAAPTGVQWGSGGNSEGVFPGQDAIIDNTTGRLVLAQAGVEFLQARTSWNVILGDVANFDASSPPNFPVSLYGTGIRSTGLGDTTFDVTADYGVIAFSHVNMANSTPISFNVGNGAGAVLQYNVLGAGRDDAATMAAKIEAIPQAIPNYECITRAINGLSSVYVINGNNGGGVNVSTGGTQNIAFSCTGTQQQIIMTPSDNPSSYVQIGTAFKTPEDYRDHVLALGTGDRDSAVPNVALVDSRIGSVAPASHTHPQSEVVGLVGDLTFLNDTKATKGGDTTAPTFGVYALGTTDNNSEVQLIRNNAPVLRSTTTNFIAGTNTLPSIFQGDSVNVLSNNGQIDLTSLASDVNLVMGSASTSLARIATTYKTVAGYASQVRAHPDGSPIVNRQFVDEATDRHRCGGAFQGNTDPTTIAVTGNVAAIAGAVTSYTSGFTVSGTTSFQYNGADTAVFFVSYTATPAITSVDRTAVFTCWLSPSGPVNPTGSPILGSRSRVVTRSAVTHTGTASASFYVSMTSGQSLRFYVSNTDAANDIVVEDFSMTALRVSQLTV